MHGATVRWAAVYHAGLLTTVVGIAASSMELMAGAALVTAIGYGFRDYTDPRPSSMTPMTVYALVFGVWCGLAHVTALVLRGTRYDILFFDPVSVQYVVEAQIIAAMNVVVPLFMFDMFKGPLSAPGGLTASLPSAALAVPARTVAWAFTGLFALDWASRLTGSSFGLAGAIRSFTASGTLMFIFVVTWDWLNRSPAFPRWTRPLMIAAVIFSAVYSAMYSNLRGSVVAPVFLVFLTILMRKRFTKPVILAAVVSLFVVVGVYRVLGEIRGTGGPTGAARLGVVATGFGGSFTDDALLLISRAGEFYSVTRVVQITEEEGFYDGETLTYLVFAFVPRMIWPDKPLIAPGQWFAQKLGRGTALESGGFSNAINMTIGGEFYLNFGWLGAFLGLTLLAATFAALWPKAEFFSEANLTGRLMGVSILLQSQGSGFASAILQLIFTYLGAIAVKWAWQMFFGSASGALPTGTSGRLNSAASLRATPYRPARP